MTAVQHTAALAPSSVQAVARGDIAPHRRVRAAESRPRTSAARSSGLHPLVLQAAQQVVRRGSYSRIQYVNHTTALVV